MDSNAHVISLALTPFLQAHILRTKQYHRFSEKLGIGYMHHTPNDPDNACETVALRILYDHTQDVFAHCFNWVSPVFNPQKHPSELLVCSHGSQGTFVTPGDRVLPHFEYLDVAERVFLRLQ